jgi:hypothetical protein
LLARHWLQSIACAWGRNVVHLLLITTDAYSMTNERGAGQGYGRVQRTHPPVNFPIHSRMGCSDLSPVKAGSSFPGSKKSAGLPSFMDGYELTRKRVHSSACRSGKRRIKMEVSSWD